MFNPNDWVFERSSGYSGWRNKYDAEWIYDEEFEKRKSKLPNVLLKNLEEKASSLGVLEICRKVLDNPRFVTWSGSSRKFQHHYGKHGLITHTSEVINLCLTNNKLMDAKIDEKRLFCAGLFHDIGKTWDYKPIDDECKEWESTSHKRNIHHISRSALEWQDALNARDWKNRADFGEDFFDDVLHAILAHHGLREWGSPVMPNSKLAWMLHLCDGISARMNDAETWDQVRGNK